MKNQYKNQNVTSFKRIILLNKISHKYNINKALDKKYKEIIYYNYPIIY